MTGLLQKITLNQMTIFSLLIFLLPSFSSPTEAAARIVESGRRVDELIMQHDPENASPFHTEEFLLREPVTHSGSNKGTAF